MSRFANVVKRLAVVIVGLGMTTTGLAVSAAPAQAAPGDLTCVIDLIDVTFDPPLTPLNLKTDATGGGPLILCFSPNGQHSDLQSATISGTGKAEFQPPLFASVKGKAKFVWNTGQESDFTFEVNTNPTSPKFEAKITSGPLKGDTSLPTGPVVFVPKFAGGGLGGFTAAAVIVNFA